MKKYKKLVRDKIPEIIKNLGKSPVVHVADLEEYKKSLNAKLKEEADEFAASGEIEEIADILEVIDAICEINGFNKDKLNQIKQDKVLERGLFSKRIILDEVK